MRGTRIQPRRHSRWAGIIPAYAGNTLLSRRTGTRLGDHPRIRGEHAGGQAACAGVSGSSPRMRGTRRISRLIATRPRDHPRVCGEHEIAALAACPRLGSSPRMRGTRRGACGVPRAPGIIPAYAGNTLEAQGIEARFRDHPRVCGEHHQHVQVEALAAGSSPRMRGTPLLVDGRTVIRGIIPAYAGNTSYWTFDAAATRDHPRVCGEHFSSCLSISRCMGSSPRMRRTHYGEDAGGHIHGIIPAYAGNTRVRPAACLGVRDHPRVCGEHLFYCLSSSV